MRGGGNDIGCSGASFFNTGAMCSCLFGGGRETGCAGTKDVGETTMASLPPIVIFTGGELPGLGCK